MKLLKKLVDFIKTPEVDIQTRIFVLLTAIGITGVFIAFLGDIYLDENLIEIAVLGLSIVMLPLITFISISTNRLNVGVIVICMGITFVILPVTFFFGGGPYGGGIIWMTFCYLYIGLILTGAWRIIMLIIMTVIIIIEYLVAYYRPESFYHHPTKTFFLDSAISVILLGFITYIVVWFQNQLFLNENKRAKEEAEKVEELNRSQNRFFSNMSHEIRTPINTILGLNEITLRRNDLPEDIIADAKSVEGAGRMLLTMVNDILDMSRLESGSMDIVPVSYRISEMLSEIVDMIWSGAESKGLRFKIDVDPATPCELFGDEVRIKQILINLLTNAIKYTKEGIVKLYVESDRIGDNEVMLTMSVVDTGMGIKKEALPYLFDAFKRVDEENIRNIEGTGLGLSIVKQLVNLMDGEITVDSVYMQGSTFIVKLAQSIVDPRGIGRINIVGSSNTRKRGMYKQSFEAPDANILIVDDNELNIKVERKLLEATRVNVDPATSGSEALNMTLRKQYDVILMDHLMPEMDGIECLSRIREQAGGLNRETPVIVLTANAGSENQELYRASGFDGYLCKPVAGAQLEASLIDHLPKEKVIITGALPVQEDGNTIETEVFARKNPIAVTTTSLCDIPAMAIKSLNIGIIPITIHTDRGTFWDGIETTADEIVKYMEDSSKYARSEPPSTDDFERFFARGLTQARQILHITVSAASSDEYNRAVQAARAFGNVTVIDSGNVSSAMGIIVLAASRMVQQNYTMDKITWELEHLKSRLEGAFVLDSTEYMVKSGRISDSVNMIFRSFMIRPMIKMQSGELKVSRVWIGRRERARRNFIKYMLPMKKHVDNDIMFVTYVGLSEYELHMIEKEIRQRADFRRIIFKRASAAISVNSGPGTFGIAYIREGTRSYNVSALIPKDKREDKDMYPEAYDEQVLESKPENRDKSDVLWYEALDGIDGEEGIRNCGSQEAYRQVLEMYYESIDKKTDELNELYEAREWYGYRVKVHALKSSSRIIGAGDIADRAQGLENASNAGNSDYICEYHEGFIRSYLKLKEVLEPICENKTS
ncbi:MAG: DegV family EDD domain-containing protein [Lachnospiraceae bacterium]|nr:DegV family EDD domain-containing protein [Lachnospiraceae bacterium]